VYVLLCLIEVPEAMPCVLLYILKAGDGGLRLLEVLEVPYVMRFVLLYMLEVFEVLEVPEVMYCVLLCMPEGVEGGLSFGVSRALLRMSEAAMFPAVQHVAEQHARTAGRYKCQGNQWPSAQDERLEMPMLLLDSKGGADCDAEASIGTRFRYEVCLPLLVRSMIGRLS